MVDTHVERIRKLLARYPKITVKRLLEELRKHDYQGGYSILCERVKQLRISPPTPWVERFETAAGVQAQMDYAVYTIDFTSEGRRRVNLFSWILSYSRRQYLRFVESQDMETTLREHIRAFEHLGGVAATGL
ncbi:MAG: transposase, partial [Deltaproteobacteria bacterium]|nr:transposase [Deltaproteobacteria bacterium]